MPLGGALDWWESLGAILSLPLNSTFSFAEHFNMRDLDPLYVLEIWEGI